MMRSLECHRPSSKRSDLHSSSTAGSRFRLQHVPVGPRLAQHGRCSHLVKCQTPPSPFLHGAEGSNGHNQHGEHWLVAGTALWDSPTQQPESKSFHPADEFLTAIKAPAPLCQPKCFVFVRHGHSTWNQQSRIQGNTDESELTETGRAQAVLAREALLGIQFDSCFSSPHTRARQTAEIVWQPWAGKAHVAEPQYLPSLSEVDLGWFQGLRNEDIARDHPDLYRVWREEPERFMLDGRYPVLDAFRQARRAWSDLLAAPGGSHLVITHKSLLRALLCTSLGLPPRQFRAIDLANGAICMVRCNSRGDMMLSALNLTSHLLYDNVKYQLPAMNKNDKLASGAADPSGLSAPQYTTPADAFSLKSKSKSSN